MARTMLDEYKTPDSFWAEAVNTACHISNRVFMRKFLKKTPYEILIGKKPTISYFKVFSCKCSMLNKSDHLSKFQAKTIEGYFLGYGTNSHSYRIYNPFTGAIVESSDVKFDESNSSTVGQVDLNDVGD
jgi:hypothetical protein